MAREHLIFPSTFEELVKACVSFYEDNKDKMNSKPIREKRAKLADFVEVFHKECGTLTPSVEKKIEELRNGLGVILMTAHQPNLFAYSGVLRKATLNFVLTKKLEQQLGIPVVSFFGVADQDFTDDRWVRSCQLPAVQRSGGILSLDIKLPEKLMLNRVAKPSSDVLKKWKDAIEKWLDDAVKSVQRLCKALGSPEICSNPFVSTLKENFGSFWNIVENCYERSERYSDFNAFVMSRIVNDVWGYDTVFSRFSECQQAFFEEFSYLLSHSEDYSRLLKEALEMPPEDNSGGGVPDQEPHLAPFWYHCDCGSKAKLSLVAEDGFLFGKGNCIGCGEYHDLGFGSKKNPNISNIVSRISARAIPMSLVFFKGLMPSCYVGGIGGIEYLTEAEHAANGLGIPFPVIALWRPHDKYLGIGQMEALLELKRICKHLGVQDFSTAKGLLESQISEIHRTLGKLEESKKKILEELSENPDDTELKEELKKISTNQTEIVKSSNLPVISRELKILENVPTVFDLIPSIIDYAVNVGLEETNKQWIRYLDENGSLSSDIHLDSMSRQIGLV